MTSTHDPLTACYDDAQLLWDLASISGTLSEITTVWRRAKRYRPELPLILPGQLHDTASQLAADVRALADAGPVQASDLALAVADRFSALQEGINSAQAITCGPSVPKVGDDRLWESLRGPLRRTGTQLTGAGTHLVTTAD